MALIYDGRRAPKFRLLTNWENIIRTSRLLESRSLFEEKIWDRLKNCAQSVAYIYQLLSVSGATNRRAAAKQPTFLIVVGGPLILCI
jgi:hypothetical protein